MRQPLLISLLVIQVFCTHCFHDKGSDIVSSDPEEHPDLSKKMKDAYRYAKANGMDTSLFLLVDFSRASNQYRFFVTTSAKILEKGLVTHGSSRTSTKEIQFSNQPNSLCSSLGKYKVGKSYHGQYGLAYKLYGLESSNSNAFARFIVLHSHECVPDVQVSDAICESWGCPTVSKKLLTALHQRLLVKRKPVLLWIFT